MNNKNLRLLFLVLMMAFSVGVHAQLKIEITAADLNRSGYFKIIDSGGVNPVPSEPSELQFPTWKTRGADHVVIGSASPMPNGNWDVRFRLMDVAKQTQVTGFAYQVAATQLRNTAHKIADAIYE